jgi:hypothetical protein
VRCHLYRDFAPHSFFWRMEHSSLRSPDPGSSILPITSWRCGCREGRRKSVSQRTRRWREPDSNHRSRVRKSESMPSSSDQTRVDRTLTLGGGAESSLKGSDIELSVSPKDIRTSPYDLCANRSDRRQSREGDRWFQRRVCFSRDFIFLGKNPLPFEAVRASVSKISSGYKGGVS